jgi:hypothetical protein
MLWLRLQLHTSLVTQPEGPLADIYDLLQDAKRVFDITESAIPHRVYEQTAIGANTWYA